VRPKPRERALRPAPAVPIQATLRPASFVVRESAVGDMSFDGVIALEIAAKRSSTTWRSAVFAGSVSDHSMAGVVSTQSRGTGSQADGRQLA